MPVDWSKYPDSWPEMRAAALDAADHRCQGCGCRHLQDGTNRTALTVHHPDRDPGNPSARLTVLCASCHLMVEARARKLQEKAIPDGQLSLTGE